MASISRDSSGSTRILFVNSEGDRKAIRLPKGTTAEYARRIKRIIETLVRAETEKSVLDARWAKRVARLPDAIHAKLAKVKLVRPREKQQQTRLQEFLNAYTARSVDTIKPATRVAWQQVQNDLVAFYGADCLLAEITVVRAEDYKLDLQKRQLSASTVATRLRRARQFFNHARKAGLIRKNPFAGVRQKIGDVRGKQRFIDRDTTERLLQAANPTWRTIIALCRYGGLRTPSETLSLRWDQVDWERRRVTVPQPKLQHHPGKEFRTIPLFPELREILAEALELAPDGAEFVVDPRYRERAHGRNGWVNCNLRTVFQKLIRRCGLTPWPRPFHNLRSSRETELAAEYPIRTVADWMGHDAKIALAHYCQQTDEDFQRAIQTPAPKVAQNPAQYSTELAGNSMQLFTIDANNSRKIRGSRSLQTKRIAEAGIEPARGLLPTGF